MKFLWNSINQLIYSQLKKTISFKQAVILSFLIHALGLLIILTLPRKHDASEFSEQMMILEATFETPKISDPPLYINQKINLLTKQGETDQKAKNYPNPGGQKYMFEKTFSDKKNRKNYFATFFPSTFLPLLVKS